MDRADAAAGCLLGTAVGDALGLPCEGLSRRRQRRLRFDLSRYSLVLAASKPWRLGRVRRPADRVVPLDELRASEDPRFRQARADDLEADRQLRHR